MLTLPCVIRVHCTVLSFLGFFWQVPLYLSYIVAPFEPDWTGLGYQISKHLTLFSKSTHVYTTVCFLLSAVKTVSTKSKCDVSHFCKSATLKLFKHNLKTGRKLFRAATIKVHLVDSSSKVLGSLGTAQKKRRKESCI